MPPRAVGRRASRLSSRDPEAIDPQPAPLPELQKPNLPRLAGTPASRRQYTYGSGVEPPPARPGRGLRSDQPLDLGHAVGNVLSRHVREDEDTSRRQMPPPPLPGDDDADRDELAGDSNPTPARSQASDQSVTRRRSKRKAPAVTFQRAESEESFYDENMYDQRRFAPVAPKTAAQKEKEKEELRDDRSFGTESDFYGDATIASSAGGTSPVRNPTPVAQPTQKKPPSSLRNSTQPRPPETLDQPTFSHPPASRSPTQDDGQDMAQLQTQRISQNSSQDSHDGPELDEEFQRAAFGPGRKPNTPVPPSKGLQKRALARQSSRGKSATSTSPHQSQAEMPLIEEMDSPVQASSSLQASRPAKGRVTVAEKSSRPDLFNQGDSGDVRHVSSYSEQDDAMQREIEATEGEIVTGRRDSWRDRWIRIKALSPFPTSPRAQFDYGPLGSQQEFDELESEEEEDELGNDAAINWWHLLRPSTYLHALFQTMDTITDWLVGVSGAAVHSARLYRLAKTLGCLVLGLAVLTPAVLAPWREVPNSLSSLSWPTSPRAPGFKAVVSKIGEYAQSVPLPFGDREDADDGLLGLWDSEDRGDGLLGVWDDQDRRDVEGFLKNYGKEFKALKKASRLHDASLKKLETVVPAVVHMELKHGKPVVAQEFWHAVRDLIRGDGTFVTADFDYHDGTYSLGPERQWKGIASKLVTSNAFESKLNDSLGRLENRVDQKFSTFWDGWVKYNDEKVSGTLGSALEKIKFAQSEHELDDVVEKLVKEKLHSQKDTAGVVVTRDEFLRHLKNEFSVHRSEIRAELDELRPQLQQLIKESAELATAKNTAPPTGMTREDVTTLVHGLLRKALADINLEAMAKGKIHAHWDTELKNQVNYFSPGAGAIVDTYHSAQTYDPHKKGVIDNDAYAKGIRGSQPRPPIAALMPWHDEGDCWCAARTINHRGNPHGAAFSVLLGHQVVPQHIVVEHILPGATTDPGARPREVEIHASIEDLAVRERVRDFAATHFPERDPTEDWNATPADLPRQFVKIGQFIYEGAELHDGVHVHRLSSELLAMGAETDQVVVRATSNYGAANHTCFYRVRMFGQRLGIDTDRV